MDSDLIVTTMDKLSLIVFNNRMVRGNLAFWAFKARCNVQDISGDP